MANKELTLEFSRVWAIIGFLAYVVYNKNLGLPAK